MTQAEAKDLIDELVDAVQDYDEYMGRGGWPGYDMSRRETRLKAARWAIHKLLVRCRKEAQ